MDGSSTSPIEHTISDTLSRAAANGFELKQAICTMDRF